MKFIPVACSVVRNFWVDMKRNLILSVERGISIFKIINVFWNIHTSIIRL